MKLKKVLSVLLAAIVMFTMAILTSLVAEATLLPIQTYEAEAILDDYTNAELSNFTFSDLLDELVYADSGEKIEIDPSAVIMWASNDLNPNDEFKHRIGYDYYTLANKNTRIPIATTAETNYEIALKLIVGSGKQLDPDNICYNVKVSYTKPYYSSDEYKIYTLIDGVKTELEITSAEYYSSYTLLYINEPINEDTPIYIEYCGKLVKTSNGEEVNADMNVNFEWMEQDEHGWLTDSTYYPRYVTANISWTSDGETLLELVRYINIYSESNESSTQSEYSIQEEYSVQDNSNSIEAYSVDPSDSPYVYNADFYIHSVYPYPLDNYDKIDCFSTKENNTTYVREYDRCTIDGHQTFFITKKDGSDIDMSSIMLELDAKITSLLVYNETEGKMTDVCAEPQDFSKNNTIHYSFTNSKGQKKHYWITVNAVNEDGAKLFVDGPSERTVYFNACYGWTHNILIANTGDEPLTGLSVTLTDAKNIKLDEYWTVGGAKNDTLASFTTSDKSKMANLANIRLLPNGNDGEIGGTLTIKADGQKDVVIKLSGKAGNPGLAIDEELEAVKYVPYSIKFETDNTFAWNEFVSYTLYGDLPEGMTYNESTGEIYGVPLETGTFDLNVMTQFSVTGHNNKSFKLEIKENTEENVRKVTAGGYAIKKAIGRVSMGIYYLSDTAEDQLFVSEGEFSEFIDLWLNGVKLQSGDDYTAVEGSTSITLSSELLQTLETDSKNTIVAEFREGGTLDGALICTAQNFTFAESTPVEQFVERLYVTMLGRAYDPTGKANHVSSLDNGKTAAEVSAKFVTSAELKSKNLSNDEFVLRMYQTFMNRTPSANEITRWATTLENGCTYEYVLKNFVTSAEFKDLCAEYGITAGTYEPANNRDYDENITAFVSRMYTTLLGRSFDASGLNNNAGIIINGGTAADVGKKFVMSGELTNLKLSNDEFVKRMYQTLLNRTPSAKEITRWATTLENGCSYGYILKKFVASAEFNTLCTKYGIKAGEYATTENRDYNENITAYVSRMYTKALGRKYDIKGLNSNTGRLITGEMTAAEVAEYFILSKEFVNRKLTDEQYVTTLYSALFNRAPDASGKKKWLNKLATGTSREEVLKGFTTAAEFKNLVASFGL